MKFEEVRRKIIENEYYKFKVEVESTLKTLKPLMKVKVDKKISLIYLLKYYLRKYILRRYIK